MSLIAAITLFLAPLSFHADAEQIARYRAGMHSLVQSIRLPESHVPTRDERDALRAVWRSFLDYEIGLESVRQRHRDFLKRSGSERDRSFRVSHAAWLAQYRAALDFIDAMERHPELHTILDESVPALGIEAGSYRAFKLHWLNVTRAAEWSAFSLIANTTAAPPLAGADADAKAILAAGVGKGTRETLRNAARIVTDAAWNPLPQGLAVVAGGAPAEAPRPSFISREQIAAVRPLMKPGDIVFERRDWSLTNIGLPGFWPHVALYVGTPAERRTTFGDAFEESIRGKNRGRYDRVLSKATIVEAVGGGTVTSTFERSADADYFAVIRPRLSAEQKAAAIARAFAFLGTPYDFEFDFVTDDRIVCSELVYKAYEGAIPFPVMRYAARHVSSPNDFVRWFDEQYGTAAGAEFVAFLDGHAHASAAKRENVEAFRRSWQRPRWHPVAHQH